jgi:hypothetical protein
MKKFYSIVVASLLAAGAFAQCTVSPLANLTVLDPLPTNDLPDGSVGLAYLGSGKSISFAASGQDIDPAILVALFNVPLPIPAGAGTFSITRVQVQSVDGVPPGMTAVSSDTPSEWNEGESGCFLLSGTPTTAGDYNITFNVILDIDYVITITGTAGTFTTPQAAPVPYSMRVLNNASVNEFNASGLNLFPNPANEMFSVSYPSTGSDMATINVTDMSGKTVYTASKSINAQGGSIQIGTDGLANGMYRVTFASGNVNTASKLVVRK